MRIKNYRAKSIQEAIRRVRTDLGPDAAILQTREVRGNLLQRLIGYNEVEVTAALQVNVPSRFAAESHSSPDAHAQESHRGVGSQRDENSFARAVPRNPIPPAHEQDFRRKFRDEIKDQLADLQSMVGELCRQRAGESELPPALFDLFAELIDAEIDEDAARKLIDQVRERAEPEVLQDRQELKRRILQVVQTQISVSGPIELVPGQRRLVALIGPTGVGKTTTIAKLAANFHLRDKQRVGLITVDTYRIAAVEQLRTYADIIDLPMRVVSTPREMREAVANFHDLDLILMDTAGRSPRDEVKIQELKSMLGEANADEVHLVLSGVAGASSLRKTAEHFRQAGATSLLITKLDEATGLGNLWPLLRESSLPLSYVTNGQNVPDDIQAAKADRLAQLILGTE